MGGITTYNIKHNWIPTKKDDIFTSDQLIDAFISGRKEGLELNQRLALSKFKENIDKSSKLTADLIKELISNKFTPLNAYLRVNSLDRFDLMIAIPEEDFLKDEFLGMYDFISGIESDNRDDLYNVFISFCSVNENFNESNVSSEGFKLRLNEKSACQA